LYLEAILLSFHSFAVQRSTLDLLLNFGPMPTSGEVLIAHCF
jgi:hypothetical protein